ncbi:MAG: 4Fe-4S binding protein, partial [Syntrophobacterales bacterium]
MKTNQAKKQLKETVETTSRFRHTISKYIIRRNSRCISCGRCAELCPYGVHPRYDNYSKPLRPQSHKCIGFSC